MAPRPPIQAKIVDAAEFNPTRRNWRMALFNEDGTPFAGSGGSSDPVGAFRELGAVGNPGYLNGWTNLFDYRTGFFKDRDQVHIEGRFFLSAAAMPGSGADGVPLFRLPVDHRPPMPVWCPVIVIDENGLAYTAILRVTGLDSGDPYSGEVDITNSNIASQQDTQVMVFGVNFRI